MLNLDDLNELSEWNKEDNDEDDEDWKPTGQGNCVRLCTNNGTLYYLC